MKRLKLFPKIFLYTMSIMLLVVVVSHGDLSACPTDAACIEYPR